MINKPKYTTIIAVIALIVSLAVMSFYWIVADRQNTIERHGIMAIVAVGISDQDGLVVAKATNKVCIGSTILETRLKLYGSKAWVYKIEDMVLIEVVEKFDLNIGDSIVAYSNRDDKNEYWCAVVEYKHDDNDWKTCSTGIIKIDHIGNYSSVN